jgi:hypothetical protein
MPCHIMAASCVFGQLIALAMVDWVLPGWMYALHLVIVCTWAQDERPADLHMAQPNVPVSKTGQIPPAKLVRGGRAMQGDHTLATIGKLVVSI